MLRFPQYELKHVSTSVESETDGFPHTQSSLEVCKLHNRLSASLLQHEALLIARWHGAIESARTGLGLPLLVQDGSRREDGPLLIGVNCQKRYMYIHVYMLHELCCTQCIVC